MATRFRGELLPWDSQPQEVVELADGLPVGTVVYIGGQKRLEGAPYATSGTITDVLTRGGRAVRAASGAYINAGKLQHAQIGAWTVVFQFIALDTLQTNSHGTVSDGGGYIELIRINGNNAEAQSTGRFAVQFRSATGGVQLKAETPGSLFAVGDLVTVAARMLTASTLEVWVNGISQPLTYSAVGPFVTDTSLAQYAFDILNVNARGAHGSNGSVDMLLWARIPSNMVDLGVLTASFAAPWQLFAPQPIRVPVSAGGGAISLVIAEALHAHAADNLGLTLDTYLAIQEALHAHAADNLTLSTTGSTDLTVAEALHAHAADNLALTLDTYLVIAEALHAHAADNVVLSTGAVADLVIAEATHAHTADNLAFTLDTWLAIAEALHAHGADGLILTLLSNLTIAEATHAHTADNVVLSFPLGALSDAEFRQMYDWVNELALIHGLIAASPLTVTPTSRDAGAVDQTISTVGTTTTVTRV